MSAHGPPRKRKARPQARSSQVELPKDGALSIDVRRRSRLSFSQPFTSPCLRETPLARWVRTLRGKEPEQ